jgi:hypothetical protein
MFNPINIHQGLRNGKYFWTIEKIVSYTNLFEKIEFVGNLNEIE